MNRAMPTAIGTAMIIAMSELTTVPKARMPMPKAGGSPCGFHSKAVRKLTESLETAMEAR
jgi:hypothetical protein